MNGRPAWPLEDKQKERSGVGDARAGRKHAPEELGLNTQPQSFGVKHAVFIAAGVACATPWASAQLALLVGAVLALVGWAVYPSKAKAISRQVMMWSVASLGLLMPLGDLGRILREGAGFAVATIGGTILAGWLLGRLLHVEREPSILVSSGTAVCGASTIAAVGPAIGASSATMAIATGAIFLLNAVGLYSFPALGHALGLTDQQFGTWCGVALHDVASVTGAAEHFVAKGGDAGTAGERAIVVKLSRVVWLPVITLAAAWATRRSSGDGRAREGTTKIPVPWLVVLFLGASVVRTLLPVLSERPEMVKHIRFAASLGFQAALFLIGSGLSRAALASVGWRVLVQAAVLWVIVAGVSVVAIQRM